MSTFRIGDTVRRIDGGHPSGHFPVGRVGIVTGFRAGDNRYVLDGDVKYSHDPDYLELVCSSAASPVRTVTRKEIVRGNYGTVSVGATAGNAVMLEVPARFHGEKELRAAAATFLELADALPLNAEGGDK